MSIFVYRCFISCFRLSFAFRHWAHHFHYWLRRWCSFVPWPRWGCSCLRPNHWSWTAHIDSNCSPSLLAYCWSPPPTPCTPISIWLACFEASLSVPFLASPFALLQLPFIWSSVPLLRFSWIYRPSPVYAFGFGTPRPWLSKVIPAVSAASSLAHFADFIDSNIGSIAAYSTAQWTWLASLPPFYEGRLHPLSFSFRTHALVSICGDFLSAPMPSFPQTGLNPFSLLLSVHSSTLASLRRWPSS